MGERRHSVDRRDLLKPKFIANELTPGQPATHLKDKEPAGWTCLFKADEWLSNLKE
ncbi:MAG TPA: hypothetical protein VL912_05345 [Candidatus Udaeobacter sp.]|nr:hypothetical protein [Candidatus Udaeobacter sp.]